LGTRGDGEVADRSPGVRLVEVPVADRIDGEQGADATEQRAECIGLRTGTRPRAQAVLTPLHRERQVFWRSLGRLDGPHQPPRSGTAGTRRERRLRPAVSLAGPARADEQVCDVVEAALRLVAIEQAVDLAQHDAAGRAVAAHMAADE